ncbi:hypothetical protein G6F31_018098 [Rhizopus arrhizus]|nr:hypothetical protein G6F31_018098 [Rhizopus arrhizus]
MEAALPLDGFDDHGRQLLGRDLGFDQPAERIERRLGAFRLAQVRAVPHGERRTVHLRGKGVKPAFIGRRLGRQGQRHVGAPMKGAFECHHRLPARRAPRHLDRVFHGFRARRLQHGLLGPVAGHQNDQRFGHFDIARVHDDVEAGVQIAFGLCLHRRNHLGMGVPHVQGADATGEIDEGIAIQVGQRRPRGALRKHRRAVGHARRHGGIAPPQVSLALRARKLR